jgi:hypothetical protein
MVFWPIQSLAGLERKYGIWSFFSFNQLLTKKGHDLAHLVLWENSLISIRAFYCIYFHSAPSTALISIQRLLLMHLLSFKRR